MKPPFDIAGDLDTPVSAFAKLAPFEPRFLLESVEGGERIGRYSFIGFGDVLQVRLDEQSFVLGDERRAVPRSQAELLDGLRAALRRLPCRRRRWGRCRSRAGWWASPRTTRCAFSSACRSAWRCCPACRCCITWRRARCWCSITSAAASRCCTRAAMPSAKSLRREVIRALRGAVPFMRSGGGFSAPTPALTRDEHIAGVLRAQEYIAAGDVYQLVLSSRFAGRHALDPFQVYRALRLINPSPYMYFCRLGALTVVGSSPEALVKLNRRQAELRPIAGTRPRADDPRARCAAGSRAARRHQGKRRARDAGGPGAQ
jgi:anthranilate synthase component 1